MTRSDMNYLLYYNLFSKIIMAGPYTKIVTGPYTKIVTGCANKDK
jgi:hypothetical protein